MNAENHSPENVKPKRSGGCLRGCLIALLVVTILLVGCGGGTYLLGRSYIARQMPVWEGRYPVLALFRLGSALKTTSAGFQDSTERQPGVNDRSLLPGDILLYPNPLTETYSIGEAQGVGFQRVAEPPDGLLGYLRQGMPQNGWELSGEKETSEGYLLIWRKGLRICEMEVVEYRGQSELWLRYTDGESDE